MDRTHEPLSHPAHGKSLHCSVSTRHCVIGSATAVPVGSWRCSPSNNWLTPASAQLSASRNWPSHSGAEPAMERETVMG